MNSNRLVSIVIPAYNEPKVIEILLLSIRNQSYTYIETIVVDDNSRDDTVTISKKYTPKVYKREHAERSIQRNFGARKAKGKYLLFLDADMELTKDVVKGCVHLAQKNSKIGGVVIPEESIARTYWEKVKAHERSFYNESGDKTTDAARFFRKSVFEKVGGYDETITGPEDWDLPETVKKSGYEIGRIKSKIYHYERVKGPFKLAQKKYYYALKSHRYFQKQNIPLISPKTIYFLRPVFYRNWRKLVAHPLLSIGMFLMFTFELAGGALGFVIGKYLSSKSN